MKTVLYEPHIITYLDILGFQEIIATKSAGFVSRLIRIVQTATRPHGWTTKGEGIRYQNFSDLCVTATPIRGHAQPYQSTGLFFLELLGLVHAQVDLVAQDVLVRGGITIGPLVMSYNVLYGPGLVKAYHLEQSAVYPRIVVDPDALALVRKDPIFWVNGRQSEIKGLRSLLRTENGVSYVDYLRASESEFDYPETDYFDFLKRHKQLIESNLQKHSGNARIRKKYEWLAHYHNTVVNKRIKRQHRGAFLIPAD
jgi:hypothetical protein